VDWRLVLKVQFKYFKFISNLKILSIIPKAEAAVCSAAHPRSSHLAMAPHRSGPWLVSALLDQTKVLKTAAPSLGVVQIGCVTYHHDHDKMAQLA
jgi:hypothetical protein